MRKSLYLTAIAAAVMSISTAEPALANHHEATVPANPALDAALTSDVRKDDGVRDVHRHPKETLTFFGVKPGMTVVDYMPSSGWYSRVLIPYLGEQGTYVGLNPELHPGLTGYWDGMRDTAKKFPDQARGWVGEGGAKVIGANTDDVPEAIEGTVDRFLIFREIHNMRRMGWLHDSLMTARKLLKEDGMLGVVQHRAKADAPASYTMGDNGYQREEDVIALFGAYGFELVERSDINANPKDPANWETGVWTLPPGYRGAGEDAARRAELDAIGESDRMTLLFRKRP
jgi:predicted methyltransferase